jgi:SAM-dependent MidA family methyltransferase
MTPLAEILLRRIAATGPISMADYMSTCLLHPEFGYYSKREPFGTAGDFTTAPEISQMFGELIGLWLAQCWMDQGQPDAFTLAEIGPGRGTLMADVLRATRGVAGFQDAASVYLVEASERLQKVQRETLDGEVNWVAGVDALQERPLFLIANEFFDALPVRQFTRDANGWREHQVGAVDGVLTLGLSAPAPIGALDHRLEDTKPGNVVEIRPQAAAISDDISERISKHGGAALFIDYGDWHSRGDTVQAVRAHQSEGILAHPGEADLTAHVDFEALAQVAGDVAVTEMTPQGLFLERMGITARAQTLAKNLSGDAMESHIAAHRRLTHPDEMGTLFKTLALYPKSAPLPAGFTE